MLDETLAAPTADLAPRDAPVDGALRPRPAAMKSLVLFVGAACRPASAQSEVLAREGMRCLWLPSPERAIEASNAARFDALVLDADALAGRAGDTLARMHDAARCPIVMLADHGDEVDEIVALELGADAFLRRPVAPRRLRAHLAALMRLQRSATPAPDPARPSPTDDAPDHWQLDRVANRLQRGDMVVELSDVQSALLQCLLEAHGRIVPRERLAAALPFGRPVLARSVDVYIHRLRARLRDAGVQAWLIEAIRSRGYVLQRAD